MPDQVIGAINVYAHGKDVFDEHAAHLGEPFAVPAAVAALRRSRARLSAS